MTGGPVLTRTAGSSEKKKTDHYKNKKLRISLAHKFSFAV
jgi:hypothetical protein